MSEIPEDVMMAAREACAAYFDGRNQGVADDIRANKLDGLAYVEIAASAILAERQRCAEVVDSWLTTDCVMKTHFHTISAAILNTT